MAMSIIIRNELASREHDESGPESSVLMVSTVRTAALVQTVWNGGGVIEPVQNAACDAAAASTSSTPAWAL